MNVFLMATLDSLHFLSETFVVNNNFFSGQIPDMFENFEKLDFFDASNNQVTGSIPESLFSIPTLRILYLSNNTLAGTLSASYSNPPLLRVCTCFIALSLSLCVFVIIPYIYPNSFAKQDLFLDGNGLTGTVPEIDNGELQQLTELLLQFNFLTGSMPASICALRDLELEDLFSDCGGSDPEIECEFPGCCNRCFEGGDGAAAQQQR
jgi:hypothetical protein